MFKSFEVIHPVRQETLDLEFDFLHGHYSVEGAYLFEVCAIQDRIGSAPLQVTGVFCFFHSHNGDFFVKKVIILGTRKIVFILSLVSV